MPTAEKTQTETGQKVRFESKTSNLILTRRPVRNGDDGFGGKIAITESEFNARREEQGLDPDPLPWKVEFENGAFETDNPELIEWLRSRKTLNANEPSGFWEVALLVDPMADIAGPMKQIAQLAIQGDITAIIDIRDEENERENPRAAIVEAAEAAMQAFDDKSTSESGDDAGTGDGDPPSTSAP